MNTSGSTNTRSLITDKSNCTAESAGALKNWLKTPDSEKKIAEGGLRLQGRFKASTAEKPLITVVTVVYNGAEYLEGTIKSVIQQSYDNVEYIIVDGGSSDGTLDIIGQYEHAIDYWVSEPDKGIYDAMNKGIDLVSGDWVNFMNAGDEFFGNSTIKDVCCLLISGNMDIFTGYVKIVDSEGKWLGYNHPYKNLDSSDLKLENCIAHQATFTRINVFKAIGKFNLSFKVQGDYEFWLRAKQKKLKFFQVEKIIANFRSEGISSDRSRLEESIREKYKALLINNLMAKKECRRRGAKETLLLRIKSVARKILGSKISGIISKKNIIKLSKKQKIIYDTSVEGATRGGVYVFSRNMHERLKNDQRASLYTFQNKFSVIGKKGIVRKLASFLRLIYLELIIFSGKKGDIFFFPAPEVPLSVLFSKRKFIVVIHDIFGWKNREEITSFARLKTKMLPLIAKKAHRVGTVSEFSRKDIATNFGIPEDKIFIVHNGLGDCYIKEPNLERLAKLKKKRYILNVGALEPRKNIVFLIDLYDFLKKNYIEFEKLKLVLTGGESWSSESIFSRIRNSQFRDDIYILGNVDDKYLPGLYRDAELMVFPSIEEGFGIPVIESLSQGTPVVVNRNSALEMFEDYGAIVIDGFDKKVWAHEIVKVLDGFDKQLSIDIERVKSDFGWGRASEVMISELLK